MKFYETQLKHETLCIVTEDVDFPIPNRTVWCKYKLKPNLRSVSMKIIPRKRMENN